MIGKISRKLLFVLALLVVIYGVARIWPELKQGKVTIPINYQAIPIIVNQAVKPLPDWTADELLGKINDYRATKKLSPLKFNDKLNNAAKSRLAVILEFGDYEGSQTGLTREKSLDNVGYRYSWVGDLILLDYFKNNDPISYWTTIKNSEMTLSDKNLKDVGIALKQTPEQVTAYVILGSLQKVTSTTTQVNQKITWGGPELWAEVNKRRAENGVNPLKQKDELCTIAAIRLNQILEKGKLDGHEGFEPTLNRPDLKWISEQYNISEFLVSGYNTPQESVKAWEATLGHRKLITGGEYVWGCVYAQAGFGVAIAAY